MPCRAVLCPCPCFAFAFAGALPCPVLWRCFALVAGALGWRAMLAGDADLALAGACALPGRSVGCWQGLALGGGMGVVVVGLWISFIGLGMPWCWRLGICFELLRREGQGGAGREGLGGD